PKTAGTKAPAAKDAKAPAATTAARAAVAPEAETKPIPPVSEKPAAASAASQPTEVIEPAVAEATPASAAPAPRVVVLEPPKPRRRRWPFVLIGVVVLVVILLIVGAVIGENLARAQAVNTIKQRVVAVLGVTDPSTVKVDIGDQPVLLQALAGKLNTVDVTASEVTFGTLSGAATLHAEAVPLDPQKPTSVLDITFAIPEEQVAAQLTQALGDIKPESVVLEEPEITVATTIDLFFFKLPVGIGLEPSAEEGRMVFTPTTVTLGDQDYTPDELRAEIGDLADPFLAQQKVCVSDAIPAALALGDVDVVAKDLVLKIEGQNVALSGQEMSANGTCDG
ncbi:MAG: LmeA family phospholipid-binding protein, partial [Pseudolysinimonas sp.]